MQSVEEPISVEIVDDLGRPSLNEVDMVTSLDWSGPSGPASWRAQPAQQRGAPPRLRRHDPVLLRASADGSRVFEGDKNAMGDTAAPWVRGRGMGRLLAQETNVSDLIQFLSDRDPSPWANLVGFVPDDVSREALSANRADLLLTSGPRTAVVEVKLGHLMSTKQQEKYEALEPTPELYLAALRADEARLAADSGRWSFIGLSDLVGSWEDAGDEAARVLAREAADVLRGWDRIISGACESRRAEGGAPLSALDRKFLARVVSRRVAQELQDRGRPLAIADVTSGGGLPLIQAWAPIRGESDDRAFIAEVRWRESNSGGELRFGVDFDPRPDQVEDEEVRRAAYGLARSMDADIAYTALKQRMTQERPDLAELISRDKPSRPEPKGDWERVIAHGFEGSALEDGRRNNRQRTGPGYYGDGALRFQAIADVDFGRASARDLAELIDFALAYLSSCQPAAAAQ